MVTSLTIEANSRYKNITEVKSSGSTYTPKELADFVARQIISRFNTAGMERPIRILDPAVGEGELLISLLNLLPEDLDVVVYGFDTNRDALEFSRNRIQERFRNVNVLLEQRDFLEYLIDEWNTGLFEGANPETFDLIIANPPYVRTQILGSQYSKRISKAFGLKGKVDLYFAFILGMIKVLHPLGCLGVIVSNRFMTTKAGANVRQSFKTGLNLRHVWDLGDTKLFDAAVLPAVILAEGKQTMPEDVAFTSIYETKEQIENNVETWVDALEYDGTVQVLNDRCFSVQQGTLENTTDKTAIWKVANQVNDTWLATVNKHTWKVFSDIGKVRVGVKTCADKVFIRKDWHTITADERPELVRALTTHHIAQRFKVLPNDNQRYILYPHESVNGERRTIDIAAYPKSLAYLEANRETLENRTYLMEAGRNWYELWVPQDPSSWGKPKLVFRDISERPCFWIDQENSIINGDCYWMICNEGVNEDMLWLALAVSNSTFIETFYDHSFNNKLYSGRRRFITQYVEKFPLPDPKRNLTQSIINTVKDAYNAVGTNTFTQLEKELDRMVWEVFGLDTKEILR